MKTRTRERASRLWTWLYRREQRAYARAVKARSAAESLRWRRISEHLYRLLHLLKDAV